MDETMLRTVGQRDLVDDECSTDSGCSSGSGSTESAEASSRRGSAERRFSRGRSAGRSAGRSERHHGRQQQKPARSWSPHKAPEPSSPPAADQPRALAARGLRRAFQTLRIAAPASDKPATTTAPKKSQKRILRSPVAYTYVKGLSGLPTQRIPRNAV